MRAQANNGGAPAAADDGAHRFAAALVDELARAGVREVCVCPGSRSAALAIAAARHDALRCWSQIDERSAGFFALGAAKATRAPAALICTSGTAAANFYPAVIEAYHARVPLVVLSADRPPELRGWGAGQTIDQIRLYGTHVRWFAETAVPSGASQMLRYARELGCRAVAEACGPPGGPVHLNLPFRDPLAPSSMAAGSERAAGGRRDRPYTRVSRSTQHPKPEDVERLAEVANSHERGVIACGPMDAAADLCAALAALARRLGWPILADPTSQLRCGAHRAGAPIVAHADLFLRDEPLARRLAPEVVLHFGATPTSKAQRLWLERHAPEHWILVDPEAAWSDPDHLASEQLAVDPLALCEALAARASRRERAAPWLEAVLRVERCAADVVSELVDGEHELLEPRAVRELAAALPDAAIVYASSSMPVRELDAFLRASERPLRVLANRGANGIDGMISSALGAAATRAEPVVLLTGDLALLHDIGALLAARRHALDLTIVVFDNDGGGIFSYLPVAERVAPEIFEAHFRTPHGVDLGAVVAGFGADFARVGSWEHFGASVKSALATPGVGVVVVPVDRDRSVAHHREIERRVSEALEREVAHLAGGRAATGTARERDAARKPHARERKGGSADPRGERERERGGP